MKSSTSFQSVPNRYKFGRSRFGKEWAYVESIAYLLQILGQREVAVEETETGELVGQAVYGPPASPWAVLPLFVRKVQDKQVVVVDDLIKVVVDAAVAMGVATARTGRVALEKARGTARESVAIRAYYPVAVAKVLQYVEGQGVCFSYSLTDLLQEAWFGLEEGFRVWDPSKGPIGPAYWIETAVWRRVTAYRLLETSGGATRDPKAIRKGLEAGSEVLSSPLSLDVVMGDEEDGETQFAPVAPGEADLTDYHWLVGFIEGKLAAWYGPALADKLLGALLGETLDEEEVDPEALEQAKGLLQMAILSHPHAEEIAYPFLL